MTLRVLSQGCDAAVPVEQSLGVSGVAWPRAAGNAWGDWQAPREGQKGGRQGALLNLSLSEKKCLPARDLRPKLPIFPGLRQLRCQPDLGTSKGSCRPGREPRGGRGCRLTQACPQALCQLTPHLAAGGAALPRPGGVRCPLARERAAQAQGGRAAAAVTRAP